MTVDLAVSPGGRPADASPIGKPGGRQNWVDKAGGLPKYLRMIAHALLRKNPTWTAGHAIAVAKNRLVKLAATSKNPKVKAAAAAAVAEWEAKQAKSHVSLAYADDPDALWVDLATLEDADAMLLLDLAPGNYRPPYDWKHGYIPITPAAALSKAKGNKKRASKLLRGGGRPPKVAGSRKPERASMDTLLDKAKTLPPGLERDRHDAELRKRGVSPATVRQGAAAKKAASSPRVAKAQDDENRGRGVPGELAATKKAAAPKPARPWDKTWSQDEKDEWSGLYASGRKAYVDARNDGKSHREAMRIGADAGGVKPDAPKPAGRDRSEDYKPGTMVHAYEGGKVAASGELVGYTRTGDARIRVGDGSVKTVSGDKLARSGAPKPDKSSVSSTGGSVSAPKGASPGAGDGSPRLSGDTVRRMSDDQLDGALSRLMAAGGSDSHALALIEKEMDRRDKAKAGPQDSGIDRVRRLHAEGKAAHESYLAAVKQHGYGHAETTAAGDRMDRLASEADKAREGVTIPTPAKVSADMDKLKANGWKVATGGIFNTAGDESHIVKAQSPSGDSLQIIYGANGQFKNAVHRGRRITSKKALDELIRGGSPKGDTPATGDTALDDLTFKADRQAHKFTDDVVSRMSQPQLERSLGTLLGAGYDNDAPVVRKLTGALEAKDPEAAKVYRKGADRTAQDAKAALRFAHGTREQQKADYHAYVEHLAHQAEASDMVGAHALSRASRNTTVRLPDLWSMTPAQIRKHASPELLEWFSKPGNEPLPFDAWRAAHLGATDRRAVESLRRRREQWLSEYG